MEVRSTYNMFGGRVNWKPIYCLVMNVHRTFKYFRCRCVWGKHPSTSRTRWLRPRRPMILCWRRHGKAGGCRIYIKKDKFYHRFEIKNMFWFQMVGKKSTNKHVPWKLHIEWYDITILPSEVLEREWKTRKTSEVKSCTRVWHNYLNPSVKTNHWQITNHTCNAMHVKNG